MNQSCITHKISLGALVGGFISDLEKTHGRDASLQIDALVEDALSSLDNVESVSPTFKDFLRYVVKKAGDQKKAEFYRPRTGTRAGKRGETDKG